MSIFANLDGNFAKVIYSRVKIAISRLDFLRSL